MTRIVALVTALGVCLNAIGLSAQDSARTPTAPSPFSRDAITRAAARAIDAEPAEGRVVRQDQTRWLKVVQLRPGSDLMVAVTGSEPVSRVFVHADDTALTVLRVNDSVPPLVVAALRDLATRDPQQLMSLTRIGSWTDTHNSIRIDGGSVFVSDRKLAALSEFVVRSDKADVAEITKGRRRRGAAGRVGVFFLTYFAGAMVIQTVADKAGVNPSNIAPGILGGLATGIGTVICLNLRGPSVIYRR